MNVKKGDLISLITLNSNSNYSNKEICMKKELFTVVEIFFTGKEIDNYLLLMNLKNAARFMEFPSQCITGWRLWFKKPILIEKIKNKDKVCSKEFLWDDWKKQKGELFQALRIEKISMSILLSMMITISLVNVMISLIYVITNKQREIAILLVQGIKKIQIVYIFSIQGMIMGTIGAFIGMIFSIFLTKKICVFLPMFGCTEIFVNMRYMFSIFIVVILFSFLFSILPAKLASDTNPSVVLRSK